MLLTTFYISHKSNVKTFLLSFREMICLQQFYNIFTTNLKWQVVTGCYYWVKKVISVLNLYLNQ